MAFGLWFSFMPTISLWNDVLCHSVIYNYTFTDKKKTFSAWRHSNCWTLAQQYRNSVWHHIEKSIRRTRRRSTLVRIMSIYRNEMPKQNTKLVLTKLPSHHAVCQSPGTTIHLTRNTFQLNGMLYVRQMAVGVLHLCKWRMSKVIRHSKTAHNAHQK